MRAFSLKYLTAGVTIASAAAFVVPTRAMSSKSISPQAASSVFDFTVEDVKGKPYPLSKLKNKKALLFVNVASE
jgi:cytochrome oxidase Cu insertion factor (SCO1/SenC/PrrC family)